MKVRSFYLGTVAAIAIAACAQAADTNAQGAEALVTTLTAILPEQAKASGFLTAVPEGDHYRLSADFGKLVRAFAAEGTKVELDSRFDVLIYPPDGPDGLMEVKREAGPLDVSGKWEQGTEKGAFSYLLKDYVFSGQFDPSISYFRSGMGHASGATMTADSGKEKVEASAGPIDQTLSATHNADGSVDFTTNAVVAGLSETITGTETPSVKITVGNARIDATARAVRFREIAALVSYLSEHAGDKALGAKEKQEAMDLMHKAMPLLGGLEETLSADKISFSVPGVGAKIDNVTYRFGTSGLTDDARLHVGFGFSNPEVTGVPQMIAYGDLMPKEFKADVSVTGLNFATAFEAVLAKADYASAEMLTKAQLDEIGKLFLKDGKITVEVPEIVAASSLYDISVKGRFLTDVLAEPVKASAEFDVAARDIDKTIKGIQELAQSIPDLNTASFGLMLAKGMAKNDADGTANWKVEVSDDGVVKVNGQVMPH